MTSEQAVSGASAGEILDLCREYTLYEWGTQEQINPIPFSRAKGIYLWDADGKRYLDFNSQAMCVNIGHADDRVVTGDRRAGRGAALCRSGARHGGAGQVGPGTGADLA